VDRKKRVCLLEDTYIENIRLNWAYVMYVLTRLLADMQREGSRIHERTREQIKEHQIIAHVVKI
jgi:hypothetical protein